MTVELCNAAEFGGSDPKILSCRLAKLTGSKVVNVFRDFGDGWLHYGAFIYLRTAQDYKTGFPGQ